MSLVFAIIYGIGFMIGTVYLLRYLDSKYLNKMDDTIDFLDRTGGLKLDLKKLREKE